MNLKILNQNYDSVQVRFSTVPYSTVVPFVYHYFQSIINLFKSQYMYVRLHTGISNYFFDFTVIFSQDDSFVCIYGDYVHSYVRTHINFFSKLLTKLTRLQRPVACLDWNVCRLLDYRNWLTPVAFFFQKNIFNCSSIDPDK